jgi:hypothetical protein
MKAPTTVRSAEDFGRARLSKSFFMRDFLYSEIAAIQGMANLPDDPDLAIAAGRELCRNLLEPLQATFGRIAVRSAYRSPEVNAYGSRHRLSCAANEKNLGRHIWDRRSRDGMGALACVVIPWLVDRMEAGVPWRAMPGGFMTTCPTASCSCSHGSERSTSAGMKCRSERSTASSLRAAFSPSPVFQITPGITAICIGGFRD